MTKLDVKLWKTGKSSVDISEWFKPINMQLVSLKRLMALYWNFILNSTKKLLLL